MLARAHALRTTQQLEPEAPARFTPAQPSLKSSKESAVNLSGYLC